MDPPFTDLAFSNTQELYLPCYQPMFLETGVSTQSDTGFFMKIQDAKIFRRVGEGSKLHYD